MIYAPTDLKAVKLRDVPAGTIIEFPDLPEDFSCAIKLADTEASSSLILPLAGEYAFRVIPWSEDGEITTASCNPAAIRFRLGPSSSQADHHAAGVLTLHPNGAFLATQKKDHLRGPKIDVVTWDVVKVANVDEGCAKYPSWEIGYVDAKGEFNTIYKRE
ncbi:hypothetical protein [Lysobacter sp. M15]|uniref:hypothetical protein n=1 Tax=Lysobacter sp. M15 TaxID=2916837 RepID=UPI001F5A79DB|nr:hypothetical protein [Lysobacter sp. M15]